MPLARPPPHQKKIPVLQHRHKGPQPPHHILFRTLPNPFNPTVMTKHDGSGRILNFQPVKSSTSVTLVLSLLIITILFVSTTAQLTVNFPPSFNTADAFEVQGFPQGVTGVAVTTLFPSTYKDSSTAPIPTCTFIETATGTHVVTTSPTGPVTESTQILVNIP